MRGRAGRRGARDAAALRGASGWAADALERRTLLSAVVAAPDVVVYANTVSGPLPPRPGHTFHVSGVTSSGATVSSWENASAITPNTTNDLVMNVAPFATNYVACCGVGPVGLLTNGITQNQTAPSPGPGQPAVGDGGASDISNTVSAVGASSGSAAFFSYNLGTAGGASPSATGYDLSEVDVVAGHADANGRIFGIDVLVEPVGSANFLSLSGGQGFSLTAVPNGVGGTFGIGVGSTQMAIVNDTFGQPLARNIQAVKLVALDCTTFFRELVVTGTAGAAVVPTTAAPTGVSAALGGAGPVVLWNASAGATGYTVLRSTTAVGGYSAVGSQVGSTSLVDASAKPGTTYFYEVVASGNGDSPASAASPAFVTPAYGATDYAFQSQFWQGSPAAAQNIPFVNYTGGNRASGAPLAAGMNADTFSVFVQGRITTDLAGPYTFFANTDDDGYLWVNGQLVSNNGGSHGPQQPTTAVPVTLAANTAYDFVFLENNRGGQWTTNLTWQEPTGIGTAGPLTVIDALHLSPTAGAAPMPQQVAASSQSASAVRVTWDPGADHSSFGYVVQRAPSDAAGNPTGAFATVGQIFSGGAGNNIPPRQAWGASAFTDTTVAPNTDYVYRVGTIQPGQSVPGTFGAVSAVVLTKPTVTAAVSAGTLNVFLGAVNDAVTLSLSAGQIVVGEGSGAVFSTPAAGVSALNVTGLSTGTQRVTLGGAFSFSGPVVVAQVSDVTENGALSAAQVALVAANSLTLGASVNTSGLLTLDADSDNNSAGTLTIPAGVSVNSGGGPVVVHASTLALAGGVNAGAGSVTYTFSPTWSASAGVLGHTASSGVVTMSQTTTTFLSLSDTAAAGLTGAVVLNFPAATLVTAGLDTSAGGASLQVVASGIDVVGPVMTGNGALSLDAPNVTVGAAVSAGSMTISAPTQVWVNGGSITVPQMTNNGTLRVGAGGAVSVGGSLTGTGSTFAGTGATGTVAYYRMEGTDGAAATGNGTVIDSSGNGFNGTAVNGPVYSSSGVVTPVPQNGNVNHTALTFDGTSQRVSVPDNPAFQLTASLTLEAYVFVQALVPGNGDGNVIFRGDDRNGLDPYRLTTGLRGAGTASFILGNELNQTAEVTGTVPLNQWIHLAATLDDATGAMCLFVNGTLVAASATTIRPMGQLSGSIPGIGIGGLQSGSYGGELYHGSIDEVRISNGALGPAQFLDAAPSGGGASVGMGGLTQASVGVGAGGVVTIAPDSPAGQNRIGGLAITAGGRFDVTNNKVVIAYGAQGDPIGAIRSYLSAGFNAGSWNGAGGIVSTTAAGNLAHNTGIGYADFGDGTGVNAVPNTILLKYAVIGDTDLDGTVGLSDYTAVVRNFGVGVNWDQGVVTYGSTVGLSDYTAVVRNFGQSTPAVVPAMASAGVGDAGLGGSGVGMGSVAPASAVAIVRSPILTDGTVGTSADDSWRGKRRGGRGRHR